MQNFLLHIGAALLVFAALGIVVVLALERLVSYRRSKCKEISQSFLDIIKPS
jgi:hypothetical protein